ncbi:MAG: hypothetical protein WCQ97_04230 [Aminobacterium sp.]|uniref:Uncharacterized protein n=1 Tax=bioreactor metagenome TaxID=1076179 RepID=A0A645EPZ0_9ZZZZ|nr:MULTISPECIES: hypothetical protein [unclassified Aminobacterium]MDD2206467.1 hypothetical protein [Aminobacterium sp.]MDD3425363.1 hypothetical protein [Aminobacterium sp.]MDD3706958.1 hypothetical protein [Aminobacterium sp.]MDD4228198.1 hypothetical protein [Aminobacterium sp.]MDD4551235.1 hypothetical protein [Aminobacterium sp.]
MRQCVLLLSFATIICYGYALAGLGGFFLGKGNVLYIGLGLPGGTVCGILAIWLWKKYLHALQEENDLYKNAHK